MDDFPVGFASAATFASPRSRKNSAPCSSGTRRMIAEGRSITTIAASAQQVASSVANCGVVSSHMAR